MKVLLVNPPRRRPLRSILPPAVESERGAFPPLGLLYLAAAIRDLPGVQVRFIDAQAEDIGPDDVAREAAEWSAEVVGLTVLTFSLLDTMDTATAIKTAKSDCFIIAGGPHPHLYPEETLNLGMFDAVLRGEGEESFKAFIANWPASKSAPPPGVWIKGGAKGDPDVAPFIEDLDSLAHPARDLSKIDIYHSSLTPLHPITTLMSSRGCPYQCVFCDRPHLGKKFRPRSAKNVVDEMQAVAEMGIKEAVFYDDTFTANRMRVVEICELILERKLQLPFDVRARVSDLKEFDLLKKAGLSRIHFGVETGDPHILKTLQKGITLDQARAAFAAANLAGIETLAYFMVGLPGETKDTLDATLKMAKELKPSFVHFSVLIPFPGTPLYHSALERGVIERDVWAEFARDPNPGFIPPIWEDALKEEEILKALARMYRSFYRQPRVIMQRLKRVQGFSDLMAGARLGLRILFMRGGGR